MNFAHRNENSGPLMSSAFTKHFMYVEVEATLCTYLQEADELHSLFHVYLTVLLAVANAFGTIIPFA